MTTTTSRTVSSSSAYAPFGEQYATSGSTDASFTGQNSDTVSGLYDFTFREYSPSQGRWASPDPAGVAAADPTNPQSWIRYAYVMNNPMSFVDPTGLWCVWGDGTHDPDESGGGASQSDCQDQGGYWDPNDVVTGCDDNTGACTSSAGGNALICGGGWGPCNTTSYVTVNGGAGGTIDTYGFGYGPSYYPSVTIWLRDTSTVNLAPNNPQQTISQATKAPYGVHCGKYGCFPNGPPPTCHSLDRESLVLGGAAIPTGVYGLTTGPGAPAVGGVSLVMGIVSFWDAFLSYTHQCTE